MALLIIAIFIAYSRAQYLGSVLAVLLTFVMVFVKKRDCIKPVLLGTVGSLLAACVVIGVLAVAQRTNLFKVAYYRVAISAPMEDYDSTGGSQSGQSTNINGGSYIDLTAEIHSLSIREEKMTQLSESISKSWVIGNGLGAAIDFDNGYVEYTYHDIVNKMGVVGLLLFFAPFGVMTVLFFRRKRTDYTADAVLQCSTMLSSIAYFLFIAYFNPCMNTTVGLSCYVLSMTVFSALFLNPGEKTAARQDEKKLIR